jgi:hypothetical protein
LFCGRDIGAIRRDHKRLLSSLAGLMRGYIIEIPALKAWAIAHIIIYVSVFWFFVRKQKSGCEQRLRHRSARKWLRDR